MVRATDQVRLSSTEQVLSAEVSGQRSLYRYLLIYRWVSLFVAAWLLQTSPSLLDLLDVTSPNLILTLAVGSTLFLTLFFAPLNLILPELPIFLMVDTALMVLIVTLSGGTSSTYYFFALTPILASGAFYRLRGAYLAALLFSAGYLTALLFAYRNGMLTPSPPALILQLLGIWLAGTIVGGFANVIHDLRQSHRELAEQYDDLAQRYRKQSAQHHQLEVIHTMTLLLHSSERHLVQERLVKAIVSELGFQQALVGLINKPAQRLNSWYGVLTPPHELVNINPLRLNEENGPLYEAVTRQQIKWLTAPDLSDIADEDEPTLVADETLNSLLLSSHWLALPLIWEQQTLGLLLVELAQAGPVNRTDNRWPVLTSLVSQAAVALGRLDRTHNLAVEKERNRIARDIHDTVAQSLFGFVFTLDACIKLLPKQADLVKQELSELRTTAELVRRQVRQSILDIWPTKLNQAQFEIDLTKYVQTCSPDHVFKVELTFDGDFDGLSPAVRRNLYRLCQESLANSAKHAQVDRARVFLGVEEKEVFLSVRDKGCGFDPKQVLVRERNRENFGLRGMKERVKELGGTCDILSQTGQGTQILVRFPLNGHHHH